MRHPVYDPKRYAQRQPHYLCGRCRRPLGDFGCVTASVGMHHPSLAPASIRPEDWVREYGPTQAPMLLEE